MHSNSLRENCPVCKSVDTELFMKGIYDSDSTDVIECLNCGLQYLQPFISKEEEDEYYKRYYNKQSARHFSEKSLLDLQKESLDYYKSHEIYKHLIEKAKNILEIGSGTGGFISLVKKDHPDKKIVSVERDSANIEFINSCFNNVEVLDEIENVTEKFDCIFGHAVFEHILDSRTFLSGLSKHLTKHGILYLTVPNKKNALIYKYDIEEYKKFAYMKQHHYTFSETAISILAEQTGYLAPDFHYLQRYGLDNHLSWLRHRKPRNYTDFGQHISQKTMINYRQDLTENKITDLMMIVLRRLTPPA
jgi:cyclopropane fatty-acyl-phospholipid synthase-like methyltransferase